MSKGWLWDINLSEEEVKRILSDINNSSFISIAAKLLSREGDAKEIFREYITREDFLASWARIRNEMKKNEWGQPKIKYWQAINNELRKHKEKLNIKKELPAFDNVVASKCTEIGKRIQQERENSGLTQKEFADKLRVSQQLISRLEKGGQNVSIGVLQNIARVLGISFESLVSYKEETSKEITRTTPFNDLTPEKFEQSVFEIVAKDGFEKPQYTAGVGDKGRDIVAFRYNQVGSQEKWYFQCKRYSKIDLNEIKKELDKLKEHSDREKNFKPDTIVFATACPITPQCRDRAIEYAKELLFDSVLFWTNVELEEKIRKYKLEDNIPGMQIRVSDLREIKNIVSDIKFAIARPDDDKTDEINIALKKSVELIDENNIEEAKQVLFTILGKVGINTNNHINELAKIYNNIGVCFNRFGKGEVYFSEAEKYFRKALELKPDFDIPKINLASVYLNKGGEENYKIAFDITSALWEKSAKDNVEMFQEYVQSLHRVKGLKEAIYYCETTESVKTLLEKSDILLNLIGTMYLSDENYVKAAEYAERALRMSPDSALNLKLKAESLIAKSQKEKIIRSNEDIVPFFSDYSEIRDALNILEDALKKADNKFLSNQIRIDINLCLLWLRSDHEKYEEIRNNVDNTALSPEQIKQLATLDYGKAFESKDFEKAYNIITTSSDWKDMSYENVMGVAYSFFINSAIEQSNDILKKIESEAVKRNDCLYWHKVGLNEILLGNKNQAILAATNAKKVGEGTKYERELALHYNAVMNRYVPSGEADRLMDGLIELQKKNPDEKILWPVKAIDEKGNPTEEIQSIFKDKIERYKNVRNGFTTEDVVSYSLEEFLDKTYAEILSQRSDPDFIIRLNSPSLDFNNEQAENLQKAESLVFDYASLLNLAKMNLLGFIERLAKKVIVSKYLFSKIQEDLARYENEDLRAVWNFLRKSKDINFQKINGREHNGRDMSNNFAPWIIDSLNIAFQGKAAFVADDLVFFRILKGLEIKGCNSYFMLRHLLEKKWIDQKMYSTSIGDLAERFYIYLPFSGDDLYQIVMEDKTKITLRSYHLVNQMLLPGFNAASFTKVFARFIFLLWRTGSLVEDKVNWLGFITKTIIEFIDKLCEVKGTSDIENIAPDLYMIWDIALHSPDNKKEIQLLEKKLDEFINRPYLQNFKETILKYIRSGNT